MIAMIFVMWVTIVLLAGATVAPEITSELARSRKYRAILALPVRPAQYDRVIEENRQMTNALHGFRVRYHTSSPPGDGKPHAAHIVPGFWGKKGNA